MWPTTGYVYIQPGRLLNMWLDKLTRKFICQEKALLKQPGGSAHLLSLASGSWACKCNSLCNDESLVCCIVMKWRQIAHLSGVVWWRFLNWHNKAKCWAIGKWTFCHHEKQISSQIKCREHLSNLPSHHDTATHQGISIGHQCYKEKCMEWEWHDKMTSCVTACLTATFWFP